MSIIVLHHPNRHNNNTHIAIENSHGNNIKKLNFGLIIFFVAMFFEIFDC